ncbi:sugar phosphate isomerase/epimerase family protein [Rodentibacter trehalosifermentans]|uniref:Xylose isomerase n=1 Tax=Rodentibacter trehalosifermentans TaxID=1908263 RepID=A0A1V3IP43_9PAST|nr:TIM barrel protein [Rodentibacter trehalosifermentans]OOF43600.1 xylose isomerase [Rodentibacter trehalosifermentans]OOF51387.1 xylose isomerase [Rodentibacter trehalosifermentans]
MANLTNLSVNTSIYDGYDLDTTFSSIRKCGFKYFELAYNQGYIGNLHQGLFSVDNANTINALKVKYGLDTNALGCTMDLSVDGFVDIFIPRIYFASLIGAKYINVCTTKLENKFKMINNLRLLRPILEETGCILCLENGGDYNFNAFITIEEGLYLINELGDDIYSINFDPGNMVTYKKDLDVLSQSLTALDYSGYFHIKDVKISDNKFEFISIGDDGLIKYKDILLKLKDKGIPSSLEIPLKIYRELDSMPKKYDKEVPLSLIEDTLIKSKKYIESL